MVTRCWRNQGDRPTKHLIIYDDRRRLQHTRTLEHFLFSFFFLSLFYLTKIFFTLTVFELILALLFAALREFVGSRAVSVISDGRS